MRRAPLLLLTALGACRAPEPAPAAPAPTEPRPPNVVFVLADDLAASAVDLRGASGAWTPRLADLAARSVVFERAYAPSGWCMPSRAAILSGRYPHTIGLVENDPTPMPPLSTFAGELRRLGYRTGAIGKWHSKNRDFERLGFDEHDVLPVPPSPGDYAEAARRLYLVDGEARESDLYVTDYFTRSALDFVRRHADEPFALWLTYNAPHRSGPPSSSEFWHVSPRFAEQNPLERVELPPTAGEDLSGKPAYHAADRAHELYGQFGPEELRAQLAAYRSLVSEVDEAVGQLIDELERLGLSDDTLLVVSSDNGIFLGEHGMLLKGDLLYEEQVRVPLVAHYPPWTGSGRTSDALVNLIDLAPTFVELAGDAPPPWMQGHTLAPLLRGEPTADRDEALLENGDLRGLATKRWKYVEHPSGARELYDLEQDPLETRDLASSPEHGPLMETLAARLYTLRRLHADDQLLP